ncbi:MAG: esterase-like activity of phytase family protein [Verrucomicrobiota bacterium]
MRYLVLITLAAFFSGCVAAQQSVSPEPRRYTLKATHWWQLNPPKNERFDASGLFLLPSGGLLTVNDRAHSLYRIHLPADGRAAGVEPLPDCFTAAQLVPFAKEKHGRYDCEGIARDAQDRFYLCEETDRWILRHDPKQKTVERLAIDWSPVTNYFSAVDANASFEGIAIGGNRLYVANERSTGRLIVVDLDTLKVIDHFSVAPKDRPAADVHYSDLCWFDDSLWVLLRESSLVLRVNPHTKKVLAEFSFAAMERADDIIYSNPFPTSTMEGLAVDATHIWLVTDNNGRGRILHPNDTRPTLFQCPRPDR